MARYKLPPGVSVDTEEYQKQAAPTEEAPKAEAMGAVFTPEEEMVSREVTGFPAGPEPLEPGAEPATPEGVSVTDETFLQGLGRVAEEGMYKGFNEDELSMLGVVGGFVENFPASAKQFASDIATAVSNPLDTTKAVGDVVFGLVDKVLAPVRDPSSITPEDEERMQAADLFLSHLEDRYGSVEAMKRTIANDPVGFMADIGTALVGGGSIVKGGGKIARIEKLAELGRAAQRTGQAVEPLALAVRGTGQVGKLIPRSLPSKLYASAAKWSSKLDNETKARITQTALDEDIAPTVRGMEKLRKKINVINDKIGGLIDDAVTSGQKIPVGAMFKNLKDLVAEAKNLGDPAAVIQAAKAYRQKILEFNKAINRKTLTPREAQNIKIDLYNTSNSMWKRVGRDTPMIRVKKNVARALKESIRDLIPEIDELNRRDGTLLELEDALQQSANRLSNRDMVGIGTPIKVLTGQQVGGTLGAGAALLLGLMDSPTIKAKAARVINKLQQKGLRINPEVEALILSETMPIRTGADVEK